MRGFCSCSSLSRPLCSGRGPELGWMAGSPHKRRMTPKAAIALAATTLAALVAIEGSALAQYDRDGRYVPSPMGVPQDPYTSSIPMYPGTPGGAVGTPVWPRAAVPETPVVPPLQPHIPQTPPLYPSFVPLTLGQCGEPWSRATRMTPTEFRRRCASMLKHQGELRRKDDAQESERIKIPPKPAP
jgi:hypothetical protein